MNTNVTVIIEGDERASAVLADEVPQWFREWENRFSRFIPTSELCELNRNPNPRVQVSEPMFDVLRGALDACVLSEGLVTPTTLEALERAGYDRSFDQLSSGAQAATAPVAKAAKASGPAPDFRALALHPEDHSLSRPVGVRLDLGGSAKGWAVDQTLTRITAQGLSAIVEAGGDIAANGPHRNGNAWGVGVESPFNRQQSLGNIQLTQGGVATSARSKRKWLKDGKWQHHLIDPRTGESATSDLISVTVVGPSAREAEVISKAMLILGSLKAVAWLEARPAYAALLVLDNGKYLKSTRLKMLG
jgi:thiamine biosynthesis lipoprotein